MKRSELFFGLLKVVVDASMSMLALMSAYVLRANENFLPSLFKRPDLFTFPTFPDFFRLALVGTFAFVLILGLFRLYHLRARFGLGVEFQRIATAAVVWLMGIITYYFYLREFPFSRLALVYSALFLVIFVMCGRVFVRTLRSILLRHGIGQRRIVFVGRNDITRELTDFYKKNHEILVIEVVSNAAAFMELYAKRRSLVEEVIQTYDDHKESEAILAFCREHHLEYHFVPDLLEVNRSNIQISALGGIPLISLRPTSLDGWGAILKRIFDIVASFCAIILLLPFLIIIAIAIKLDSPGPIFFRRLDDGSPAQRVGARGHYFVCLKLRTMKANTHSLRYTQLADRNIRKGTPLVKIKNDPRITRVGKMLRRFSLDELPNLWNVLCGEMSLVGPRPHLPEEVAAYKNHQKFVLTIKPGITGLAQISGRSDLPFDEEVRLDTYYIQNWSLWLDVKILVKTVGAVLRPYKE